MINLSKDSVQQVFEKLRTQPNVPWRELTPAGLEQTAAGMEEQVLRPYCLYGLLHSTIVTRILADQASWAELFAPAPKVQTVLQGHLGRLLLAHSLGVSIWTDMFCDAPDRFLPYGLAQLYAIQDARATLEGST